MSVEKCNLVAIVLAGGKGTRMKADVPKVLHDLSGTSVIRHAIDNLRKAGIGDVIVVVGHRGDLVIEHLDGEVRFAVQERQLGTGHAVHQALSLVGQASESVFVCYGDMPFLSTSTIRTLVKTQSRLSVAGVILTMVADDPPDYGRVIRDKKGRVKRVVEVKDCTAEELKVREVNVGVYCFEAGALRWALPRLDDDNAQGEYQLTDVVEVLVGGGHRVE